MALKRKLIVSERTEITQDVQNSLSWIDKEYVMSCLYH
jgi:hypothetical protein